MPSNTNGTNGSRKDSQAWSSLPSALDASLKEAQTLANKDSQLKAFTTSDAITGPVTFGIVAAGSKDVVEVTVSNGNAKFGTGDGKDCLFTLSALPKQWEEFFKQTPVAPYQSYWGM